MMMFYINLDTTTIFAILKRLKILPHVSNAPDVANYGLIVPLVIDTKRHVGTSASMNSSVVIVKRPRIYSKICLNDSKKTNFSITI